MKSPIAKSKIKIRNIKIKTRTRKNKIKGGTPPSNELPNYPDNHRKVVKIAIIVPFRDSKDEQNRTEHLNRFLIEMPDFLKDHDYRIYIIEQSEDEKLFNRGKLLNVGFRYAEKDNCDVFIFHDVDLMPSEALIGYYTKIPYDGPINIAKLWRNRYANENTETDNYFGGIVSF